MSSENIKIRGVCLFCYKKDNKSSSNSNHQFFSDNEPHSRVIKRFFKLLQRYLGEEGNLLRSGISISWSLVQSMFKHFNFKNKDFLSCCPGCVHILESFCDLYHEWKCIELRLKWRLDCLVEAVALGNRIPTRVKRLRGLCKKAERGKVRAGRYQDVGSKSIFKDVTDFRRDLTEKCLTVTKAKSSFPRVYLHNDALNAPNIKIEPQDDDDVQLFPLNDHFNVTDLKLFPELERTLVPDSDSNDMDFDPPLMETVYSDDNDDVTTTNQEEHADFEAEENGKELRIESNSDNQKKQKKKATKSKKIIRLPLFKCDFDPNQCTARFSSVWLLRKHKKSKHGVIDQCQFCLKVFRDRRHLRKHLQFHQKDFTFFCPDSVCGRSFATEEDLNAHSEVFHNADRKYDKFSKCPYPQCGKSFQNSYNFQLHLAKHSKNKVARTIKKSEKKREKPCEKNAQSETSCLDSDGKGSLKAKPGYICEECGKCFRQNKSLKDHKLRKHLNPESSPVSCDHCGKTFPKMKYLNVHMVTHTKEKSHQCSICGSLFSYQSSMQRHMKTKHKDLQLQLQQTVDNGVNGDDIIPDTKVNDTFFSTVESTC